MEMQQVVSPHLSKLVRMSPIWDMLGISFLYFFQYTYHCGVLSQALQGRSAREMISRLHKCNIRHEPEKSGYKVSGLKLAG